MAKEELNKEGFKQVSGGMDYKKERRNLEAKWAGKLEHLTGRQVFELAIEKLKAKKERYDEYGRDDEFERLNFECSYLWQVAKKKNPNGWRE